MKMTVLAGSHAVFFADALIKRVFAREMDLTDDFRNRDGRFLQTPGGGFQTQIVDVLYRREFEVPFPALEEVVVGKTVCRRDPVDVDALGEVRVEPDRDVADAVFHIFVGNRHVFLKSQGRHQTETDPVKHIRNAGRVKAVDGSGELADQHLKFRGHRKIPGGILDFHTQQLHRRQHFRRIAE